MKGGMVVSNADRRPLLIVFRCAFLVFGLIAAANVRACLYSGGAESCAQDCIEHGGGSMCSEPVVERRQPQFPADEENWQYINCSGFTCGSNNLHWCCAAGGVFHGCTANQICTGLPYGIWAGGGNHSTEHSAIATLDSRVIHLGGCPQSPLCAGTELVDDTGWGGVNPGTGGACTGGTLTKNGIIFKQVRNRTYNQVSGFPACDVDNLRVWQLSRHRDVVCPVGYLTASKHNGDLHCYRPLHNCPVTGNPVAPATGAKLLEWPLSSFPSGFGGMRLRYNSAGFVRAEGSEELRELGDLYWRLSYSRRVDVLDTPNLLARLQEDEGHYTYYLANGDEYPKRSERQRRLIPLLDSGDLIGWLRLDETGTSEVFDADGRMVELRNGGGERVILEYDVQGRLTRIKDQSGRRLDVDRSMPNHLALISPDQLPVIIEYDALGRVVRIEHMQQHEISFAYAAHISNRTAFLVKDVLHDGAPYAEYVYDSRA